MTSNEEDLGWPRLDDGPGPAKPLDAQSAQRMVARVVQPPVARRRWRQVLLLAAAVVLVSVSAIALARKLAGERPAPSEPPPKAQVVEPPSVSVVPTLEATVPVGSTPAASSHRAPSLAPPEPGDLLLRANDLRAQRKWSESEATYEQVIRISPSSPAAQAARIAAGELKLDELGDPRGAERLFAAADRRGGALGEEAAWGLARSHRATGDAKAERTALEDYLARYPSGAMAPAARNRLSEIVPSP